MEPRQRLAFILGEILGVRDEVGSQILETTPANFRQILSRARRDLYEFLNRQCGLVNQSNPCRCANKASGFIERGWVKPANPSSSTTGFEPRHAAAVSMDLGLQGYDETRGREFQRRLIERVRALPGIESAALINALPLTLNISNNTIFIEGKPVPKAADVPMAAMYRSGPGYFRTAQTKLTNRRTLFRRAGQAGIETRGCR